MLDPRFQHVEQQYQTLRAQFTAGALTGEAFEAALRGMMIEEGGRYWHIGAATGHWFVSDGDHWVEAVPPQIGPPPAEPESLAGGPAAQPSPTPAAPPPAATPHPVAQPAQPAPAPRPAAPVARPSGNRAGLAGWGGTLLVLGIGSFILPLMGMQFRILELFGPAQPVVAIGMAVVGVILLILSRTGGARPSAVAAPAAPAPRPAGAPAPGAPSYQTVYNAPAYTPRGPGGCLIGCLVAIGAVILLLIVGFMMVWPRVQAQLQALSAQAAAESSAAASSDTGTATGDTGEGARFANGLSPPPASDQPSCPPGYVPPEPQLGSPQSGSQPACVPLQQ